MRNALTTTVGLAFLVAVGCGNPPPNSTGGSNGTNGGTSGPLLDAGAPCTGDNQCASNICGVTGTGTHCCTSACVGVPGETCAEPQDCDDTGKCVYPPAGFNCGMTCTGDIQTDKTCDGTGGCSNPKTTMCPNSFSCNANGMTCNSSCSADGGGCAVNFFCNQGACVPTIDTGPCNGDNDECSSGLCAPNGYCCREPCPFDTKHPECGVFACTPDAGGACVYPPATTTCDTANETCTGSTLNAGQCDGMGACNPASIPCPGNKGCDPLGMACVTSCENDLNCAAGYYCVTASGPLRGTCAAQSGDGGCTANDQCLSDVCGVGGSGNCCAKACNSKDSQCGAADCDGTTALCQYPDAGTACKNTLESCTANVQTNPTICDGAGSCPTPNPATTNCAPYTCNNGAACYATCKDNTACLTGGFCDPTAKTCCPPLAGAISVDAAIGKNGACCGGGGNPCQTIAYAMQLVDAANATGTIITATVAGNGGDWKVAGETYPIVLGWGVELNAPGIAFEDPNSVGPAAIVHTSIFDIKAFSPSDTVGYASIFGTAASPVTVGMDSKTQSQSKDTTAILVEGGNTLYLAGANVNGNSNVAPSTAAITVQANATLTLGADQPAKNLGTVTIGTKAAGLSGGSGIVCGSAGAMKSCTVNDVSPGMGLSGVVILNQANYDIDAEDMASISLTAGPMIGVPAAQAGFGKCNTKTDGAGTGLNLAAVLLRGSATMTIDNGTVQCISAAGFRLTASASSTAPGLTMDSTTVENTELGIFASAGTATVTNSSIRFNYNGVEQTTDAAGNAGTIDLSGGGNTVICSSDKESVVKMEMTPGVNVLNTTSSALNASMTAWDTTVPDQFSCNAAFSTCSCVSSSCSNTAGSDDMDAVYTGTGAIVTTGNTQSPAAVAASCN